MCRWQTEESLLIYARLNATEYARLIAKAMTSDVSSVRTTSLDGLVLDDDAIVQDILRVDIAVGVLTEDDDI